MRQIFISHIEEDAEIALQLALDLEKKGYSTWCYELDSLPGKSYLIQTKKAIERSRAVLLLISSMSVSSLQVSREVVRAHESGKHFIPLLLDITHTEFQKAQPEWQEALGSATAIYIPSDGVSIIVDRVIEGLRALRIYPKREIDTNRINEIRGMRRDLTNGRMFMNRDSCSQRLPQLKRAKRRPPRVSAKHRKKDEELGWWTLGFWK